MLGFATKAGVTPRITVPLPQDEPGKLAPLKITVEKG
jgi:hypothetical protein